MAKPVAPRGEGRERVLAAALALFAEHGISGTSLQMIAERLGVTKAAVYYQFQSKDDIVLAVLSPAFEQMAAFIAAAEAERSRAEQLETAIVGLVDLVVAQRRVSAVLRGDPVVARIARTREPLRTLTERLNRLLLGPNPSPVSRVAVSMVGGGLMLTGADPQLANLDDQTLRRELLRIARAILQGDAS